MKITGKKEETKLKGAIGAGEAVGKLAGVPGSAQVAEILRGLIKSKQGEQKEVWPIGKNRTKGKSIERLWGL